MEGQKVCNLTCSVCGKKVEYLYRYFDRFGIYSGRACSEKCSQSLPGLGNNYNYEPTEPIESDDY